MKLLNSLYGGLITFISILGFFLPQSTTASEVKPILNSLKTTTSNSLFLPIIAQNYSVSAASQSQEKPRIAVLDFEYSSISNPNILGVITGGAKGVSDILVNKLVEGGKYRVIERSQLEAILKEQNLGISGRVDASTAAQIGRILGVEAVIMGSITQFDLQQKNSGFNVFGIGVGGDDTDAYVKLNLRIVNTTTAEIILAIEGSGNASQSDNQVEVYGVGGGSSTSNEGKLLTLATELAIDKIVSTLDSHVEKLASLPKALPEINALVADVSGNSVVLNKGSSDGYQPGMQLSIERITKEVKDPQTGKVIRQMTQQIGMIKIVDVDGSSSVGEIVSGSQFKIGDVAKPIAIN